MSNDEFINGLSPSNYETNGTKEKPTIKSVILEVLEKKNEQIAIRKKSDSNADWLKYFQPYSFLDNPTMCRLLESQLLKLYNWEYLFNKERIKSDKVNEGNFDHLISFLYNDSSSSFKHRNYGGTDFEDDYILCRTFVYPPLTTGWKASYKYYTSKDDTGKDIIEISHDQTGSHTYAPFHKEERLVFDRSGLQTEARISSGYGFNSKAYILKRSKDNIFKIEMTEYPYGFENEKNNLEDIKTYELDLRDLIDITKDYIETYDPILKSTVEDPLLIPSIDIFNDNVREQLEKKQRQPGEIKMLQNEIDKRIEEYSQNENFKIVMQKMGLIQEGR